MESQFPEVTDAQPRETETPLADDAKSSPSLAPPFAPSRLHRLMAALKRKPRSVAVNDLFEGLCEVLDPDRCARDCPEYESHSVRIARWQDGPDDEPYMLASVCNHCVTNSLHRVARILQLQVDVPPAAVPHLEAAEDWVKRHAEAVSAYRAKHKDRTKTRVAPL